MTLWGGVQRAVHGSDVRWLHSTRIQCQGRPQPAVDPTSVCPGGVSSDEIGLPTWLASLAVKTRIHGAVHESLCTLEQNKRVVDRFNMTEGEQGEVTRSPPVVKRKGLLRGNKPA